MRNITVSIDDQTYRRSRIRAAELDTSVSALVRHYLHRLAQGENLDCSTEKATAETERERREHVLHEVFEDIRATRPGFRASENLPREALYDRDAFR